MRYLRLCFAITTLLVASSALSQGASFLIGSVTLARKPLPGVTVTMSSPALEGTQTKKSDVNGAYAFHSLPAGTYTVTFEMENVQTLTRTVRVGIGVIARCDVDLTPSAKKNKASAF